MPRYHRVEDIIQLARALQVPGPGLCLEDIQQRFDVGRRTAERMREAVDRLYPGMTSAKGSDGRKYWRLPTGEANQLVCWLREEVDALAHAIRDAERSGDATQARALAALYDKVEALGAAGADRAEDEPDAAGPMAALGRAIVLDREIVLHRNRRHGEPITTRARPYGLLGGPRPLLVAVDAGSRSPRLHALEEIREVRLLETRFERDPNVDLRRFAANAFVPFEEPPVELCWRFAPEAADDALEYEFHPDQQIDQRADGSIDVRFQADSLVEMAWHLFAWGDRVQTQEPPVLNHHFGAMMQRALATRPAAQPTPAVPSPRH
jgi:predicted DNA-binding transcriptional regulator YafY